MKIKGANLLPSFYQVSESKQEGNDDKQLFNLAEE